MNRPSNYRLTCICGFAEAPVIISGVRTSAVMIIGTATLAALIGAGGLGSFILLGIDRNNAALIIIGAVSSAALAGFTLEFNDRDDGTRGLKRLYGLNLNVKTMEPALRYQALEAGSVQIIDAYSTDSDIKRYGLTVLRDDKQLFPTYQGAPLLRNEPLKRYPQLKAALETLSGQITEEEMSAMNYEVEVHGTPAAAVATEYLVRKGLLK